MRALLLALASPGHSVPLQRSLFAWPPPEPTGLGLILQHATLIACSIQLVNLIIIVICMASPRAPQGLGLTLQHATLISARPPLCSPCATQHGTLMCAVQVCGLAPTCDTAHELLDDAAAKSKIYNYRYSIFNWNSGPLDCCPVLKGERP